MVSGTPRPAHADVIGLHSLLIAVIGGRGTFGARIVHSLAHHPELEVLVVGRSAEPYVATAPGREASRTQYLCADIGDRNQVERLLAMRPSVVVDTAGPFQERDHTLAAACAQRGIHFVDIADGPGYVAGVAVLDEVARANGALVVSGASTVPAVSTVIVGDLAPDRYGGRRPRGRHLAGAALATR